MLVTVGVELGGGICGVGVGVQINNGDGVGVHVADGCGTCGVGVGLQGHSDGVTDIELVTDGGGGDG